MDNIDSILTGFRDRGITISLDGDRIQYQANKGVITSDDLLVLKSRRNDLVAFLRESAPSSEMHLALTRRMPSEVVPLTFSQSSMWQTRELARRGRRYSPMALRLVGHLHVAALCQALREVVSRHEALRTTILVLDGVPIQKLHAPEEFLLDVVSTHSVDNAMEATAYIDALATEEVDVSEPLFTSKVIEIRSKYDDDHVLVILWDHLTYDGTSIGIFWRELWTIYGSIVNKIPVRLPEVTIQFPDYAVWQQRIQRPALMEHGRYWRDRLSSARRIRLSPKPIICVGAASRWESTPLRFDNAAVLKLRNISRREGTTVVMSFLAAYFSLLACWCNTDDAVVPFVTASRDTPDVEHTIGVFGSVTFLRLERMKGDRLVDILKRVTTEYGLASEHHDFGMLAAQRPEPEFALNPVFNWFPKMSCRPPTAYFDEAKRTGMLDNLNATTWNITWPTSDGNDGDYEPKALLFDSDDCVTGCMTYRINRISSLRIEHFARNFSHFVELFANAPNMRASSLSCIQ